MDGAATVVVLIYYLPDSKANKFLSDALVVDSITVALRGILKSCGKISLCGRYLSCGVNF
jgi:hypothetical protein